MSDEQLVDELAAVVWGLNLDRDAHSIARDLVPVVRKVAEATATLWGIAPGADPLVAPPGGTPPVDPLGAPPGHAPLLPLLAELRAMRWPVP